MRRLGFFRVAAGGDLEAVGNFGVGLETGGGWGSERVRGLRKIERVYDCSYTRSENLERKKKY
jgi:hypothetical protein